MHTFSKLVSFFSLVFVMSFLFLPLVHSFENNTVYLSSCSTLNETGKNYILTQDVISNDFVCFLVVSDYIVLDGNGHYIISNTSSISQGVKVNGRFNVTIHDLKVVGFGSGIFLGGGGSSYIHNNTISSSVDYGVFLLGSDNNLVAGNLLLDNDVGVFGTSHANNNIIFGNFFNNTLSSAIYLDNVGGNTISSNNIFDSGNAIFLSGVVTNMDFNKNYISGTSSFGYDVYSEADGSISFSDMFPFGKYQFSGNNLLTFKDSNFGQIKFLQPVSGSGNNLTDDIQIKDNSVTLKTSLNPGLNVPAQITLYGIGDRGFLNPVIKRNLVNCPSNVCTALTPLNAQNVIFNVTGFANPITTYRIGGNRTFNPNINPIGCYSKGGTCPDIY